MADPIPQSVRVNDNLLSAWEEYVAPIHAHQVFKTWAGISLISAALTRRVWFRSTLAMPPIIPNLFVLLCGAPGSGKDNVITTVRNLLITATAGMEQQQGVVIAPESLSTKGLIDALADEEARLTFNFKNKGKTETVHIQSLYVINGELGSFMPDYQTQLVSIINALFNCQSSFTERVRGRGQGSTVKIENPHLAMLLGTQPAVFTRIVPVEAFSMGFTARLIICSAGVLERRPFFGSETIDAALEGKIISDIRAILHLAGEYKLDKRFKERLNEFHLNNPNAIKHSRFEDYNVRRSLHLSKIAMVCAAAESNELVLEERHFDQALNYLLLSEKDAPSLFDGLVTDQGFSHTVEQVLHGSAATQSTVTHAELERKLRRTHKPTEVGQIIRSMLQAEDIVFSHYNGGVPVYNVNTKAT